MRSVWMIAFAGFMTLGWADTITLRDGRTVNGTYLGGDSRTVRFAGGDRVDTFTIDQITSITCADNAPEMRRRNPEPRSEPRLETRTERPREPEPGPELKSGTALTVRM